MDRLLAAVITPEWGKYHCELELKLYDSAFTKALLTLPCVAPVTDTRSLRKPGAPNIFYARASYAGETQRWMGQLVGFGIQDVASFASFWCCDLYGDI